MHCDSHLTCFQARLYCNEKLVDIANCLEEQFVDCLSPDSDRLIDSVLTKNYKLQAVNLKKSHYFTDGVCVNIAYTILNCYYIYYIYIYRLYMCMFPSVSYFNS